MEGNTLLVPHWNTDVSEDKPCSIARKSCRLAVPFSSLVPQEGALAETVPAAAAPRGFGSSGRFRRKCGKRRVFPPSPCPVSEGNSSPIMLKGKKLQKVPLSPTRAKHLPLAERRASTLQKKPEFLRTDPTSRAVVSGIFSIWPYCKVNLHRGTNSHLPWAHGLKLQGNPLLFHGNQTQDMPKTSANINWWKSWWFHPVSAKAWPLLDWHIWLHWSPAFATNHPPLPEKPRENLLSPGEQEPVSKRQLQIPASLSPFPHGVCCSL